MRRAFALALALALAFALAACHGGNRIEGDVEVDSVPTAQVVVRLAGSAAATTTGDDGRFELSAPGHGPFVLIASGDGLEPAQQTVTVTDHETARFSFHAVGSVTGRARRGGLPGGNSRVRLSVPGTELSFAAADDGTFSLDEVPVGTWLVVASAQGFATVTSQPVTVRRAQTSVVNDLVLPLVGAGFTGTLAGRVERVTSASHDGVRVLVEGAGLSTVTADGGLFTLTDVPEGNYTLALEYDDLVERVPNVVTTRNTNGFIVDQNLYRLEEVAIPLMGATRIDDTSSATQLIADHGHAAWMATDPLSRSHVRWASATDFQAREAGVVTVSWNSYAVAPLLVLDGAWMVWSNDHSLLATSTIDGGTTLLADNFRRTLGGSSRVQVSAGGLVAFEAWVPGTNSDSIEVTPMPGVRGEAATVQRWADDAQHVYLGAFMAEALLTVTDVDPAWSTGTLTWWKQGVSRSLGVQSRDCLSGRASSSRQYLELTPPWSSETQLVDVDAGLPISTHSAGPGVLDDAEQRYAWRGVEGTHVLELATRIDRLVTPEPIMVWCVFSNGVVGQSTSAQGEVVFISDAGVTLLAPGSPNQSLRQVVRCVDDRVYFTDGPAKLMESHPPQAAAAVAAGLENLDPWQFDVIPEDDTLWVGAASYYRDQQTLAQLWRAPRGGAAGRKIADDVVMYPRPVVRSPNGTLLAFNALGGLFVMHPDGTGLQRIATGVDAWEWLSPEVLVLTRKPPPPPLRFQAGVYLAKVAP